VKTVAKPLAKFAPAQAPNLKSQYHQVRENQAKQQTKGQTTVGVQDPTSQPAAMMEQIQMMIKNGKKHFGKDLEKEQEVLNLREYLCQMTNGLGDLPASYDSTVILNKMIQDLLKMKFSEDATKQLNGQKGQGPTQRAQSM